MPPYLVIVFVLLANSVAAQQDTITDLSLLTTEAVYKAPNGKVYHVTFAEDEESAAASRDAGLETTSSASTNKACDPNNVFDGSYRKKAKTSIASHKSSSTSLAKLIKRVKAIDKNSVHVTSSSQRIMIEDSVVTLISVFLYAIAREADEDYHIIIGTSGNPATAKFFNIECSGLPASTSSSYIKIKAVRQKVNALLGGSERCKGGYVLFNDHPRVKIVGSLFYDKEHENKIPGPAACKPATAWELHPITEFKML